MNKKIRSSIAVVIFCYIFNSFLFTASGFSGEKTKELEVVYLDVGQGDATLINTPGGKHILIDGGIGVGSFGSEDQGKKTILPYLRSHGINHLDTVVGTHPDFDHIGGLVSAIRAKNLTVGVFLDPGVAHPSRGYMDLLNAVKERTEIKYRQPRAGDILDWGKEVEVEVEVISPPYLLKDNNESSIVIKLTYGDISFLFSPAMPTDPLSN